MGTPCWRCFKVGFKQKDAVVMRSRVCAVWDLSLDGDIVCCIRWMGWRCELVILGALRMLENSKTSSRLSQLEMTLGTCASPLVSINLRNLIYTSGNCFGLKIVQRLHTYNPRVVDNA